MAFKIAQPNIPQNNNRIPEPKIEEKPQKPVIGISFLQVTDNHFGLKELSKIAKKRTDRNVYKELETFINCASKMDCIEAVVERYHSKTALKNRDHKSEKMVAALKREYNIDATDLIHVHCQANGKGEFVLHGFISKNVFEVVWIDPEHTLHKV